MTSSSLAYRYEASPHGDFDRNPRSDPALDFRDRDLAAMTPDDYRALGFLSGLEVHQQLASRGKLFCRCPAGRRSTAVDAEVLRHMRPTLSELGEYDGTALMEFKTRKEIVYLVDRATACTYELDDTPPFALDDEAVDIAVLVSSLFDLDLVSELHVMRKQYLDGSIPAGFQRTALLGIGGEVPFRVPELGVDRTLRIRQISLEEDACREVSDIGHRITFRTDRLGTPLTETVTEPELLTPHELHQAARLVARTAQVTGRVGRGPGAARQDVNVSVAGGRRVEIKGVGRHRGLPLLTHIEAFRQLNLLRLRAELHRRGVEPAMLALPRGLPWQGSPLVSDAAAIVRRAGHPAVARALERRQQAYAARLPGFRGLLDHPTQPGRSFADELADRVRVIACLQAPFLLHTDAGEHGLSNAAVAELRAELKCGDDDSVVVVWGPPDDMETAVRELLGRAAEALDGVPPETRQPLADGTTGFERLLPGPERMYPDTDTPPVPLADDRVQAIAAAAPERPWQRIARYRQLGLDDAVAEQLAAAPWSALFDELRPLTEPCRRRLAYALAKRLPYYRRQHGRAELPAAARLAPLVAAIDHGRVRAEAFERIFDRLVLEPDGEPETVIAGFAVRGDEEAELERVAGATGARRGEVRSTQAAAAQRWAMGQAMPALLGRLDPARVATRLGDAIEAAS